MSKHAFVFSDNYASQCFPMNPDKLYLCSKMYPLPTYGIIWGALLMPLEGPAHPTLPRRRDSLTGGCQNLWLQKVRDSDAQFGSCPSMTGWGCAFSTLNVRNGSFPPERLGASSAWADPQRHPTSSRVLRVMTTSPSNEATCRPEWKDEPACSQDPEEGSPSSPFFAVSPPAAPLSVLRTLTVESADEVSLRAHACTHTVTRTCFSLARELHFQLLSGLTKAHMLKFSACQKIYPYRISSRRFVNCH